MFLLVAATELEMTPLREALAGVPETDFQLTGVGPVEAAVALTRCLAFRRKTTPLVLNVGVGGAFTGTGVEVLDLCLATQEVLADFGICHEDEVEPFPPSLPLAVEFDFHAGWLVRAEQALAVQGLACRKGGFVTVCGVSASRSRGERLRDRYRAICENMEGAAVARVCREFAVPCLELRCISNLVEDRDPGRWRLRAASEKAARAAALVVGALAAAGR